MKANKVFKLIGIILLLLFFFLIIASKSGYYEYELREKKTLTDEAIERFEEDVKNGKNIDINNYIDTKQKDYNNKISDLGNKVSDTISKIFSSGFDYLFRYINSESEK